MNAKHLVARCCIALALVGTGAPALAHAAQMGATSDAATGQPLTPAKALDAMLSVFEEQFLAAARAMPAEKYSFVPPSTGPAKFDGVRSFAKEVTHVASANYYFYSTVSGTKPDVDVKSIGNLTDKEEILKALEASFVFAHKSIATITPENAFLTIKGADGMNTRATVAAFGVAHGFDHYGQLVEYLRMNGVIPPGSK